MEILATFIDIILHLDKHLIWLVQNYGNWIYLILFLIIFCETGLVVTPFLPGDSLLFVAGAIAATGAMDVQWLAALLILAAFCGDNTNYWIGRYFGPRIFSRADSRLLNRAHLEKTNQILYEAWWQNHHFCAFSTDHSHFCAFRGRYRAHDLPSFHGLQRIWQRLLDQFFRIRRILLRQRAHSEKQPDLFHIRHHHYFRSSRYCSIRA